MTGYQYGQKTIWQTHPESIQALRDCIALRMSSSETAATMAERFQMPVNTNTVIGKARRLGIKFDSTSKNNTFAKHGQGRARPPRKASVPPTQELIRIAIAAPEKLVEAPHGRGLPLLSLARRDCRYPTGLDEDGRHLFCAEAVSESKLDAGRHYCAGHAEIAYRPAGKINLRPVRQANSVRAGIQS